MMAHLHVKATEPKPTPQPVSSSPEPRKLLISVGDRPPFWVGSYVCIRLLATETPFSVKRHIPRVYLLNKYHIVSLMCPTPVVMALESVFDVEEHSGPMAAFVNLQKAPRLALRGRHSSEVNSPRRCSAVGSAVFEIYTASTKSVWHVRLFTVYCPLVYRPAWLC